MLRRSLMMLSCGVLVTALAPAPGDAHAGYSADHGFSAGERDRLDAGELVQRPARKRHGSLDLMGGSAWQVIDAAPDAVWQALLDTERYPRMMPRVLEARVVEEQSSVRTVYFRQGAEGLMETSYYLRVEVDADAREIGFRIDPRRPHDVKAAYGFYAVRPYGSDRTLLTYSAMTDPGGGLVLSMLRDSMQEWMLKTPWMIKRFVEGSGRWLYG